jgi:hypothetical protein
MLYVAMTQIDICYTVPAPAVFVLCHDCVATVSFGPRDSIFYTTSKVASISTTRSENIFFLVLLYTHSVF